MFNNQIIAGSSGQGGEVQQSLKFNDDESQYLSWTPAAAGNRKTWTWSGWVKRGNLGTTQQLFHAKDGVNYVQIGFSTANKLQFQMGTPRRRTNRLFQDTGAWYHIVAVLDTTDATGDDRLQLWVNGERQTSFDEDTDPTLNADYTVNNTVQHHIGRGDATHYADGYLSDINFIDGQALDATSFGQFTNGYWEKIDYAGSYGTNGFHLTFQDDVVSEGFNTVTYRGNDATNRISGLGFSPDLVWLKNRDVASTHRLYNSLTYGGPYDAGVAGSKFLASNSTAAETTGTANSLISLDADGFSVHGSGNDSNDNGEGYVAWCWDAGSGSPVSNTDGTITSTVKANTDYGFSIVNYVATGANATIGHGLGVKPDVVIVKNRDTAGKAWPVYHSGLGGAYFVYLNQTDATQTFANAWNATEPTSSVFSIGTSGNTGGVSGDNYIAYCFNSVAGYSSFGSYTGTGASGNSITGLGFRPAWLMVKLSAGGTGGWIIWDNTRDTNDADVDNPLFPNLTNVEFTSGGTYDIQFDSDGFTINNTSPNHNGSGNTYIYMAFADTREAAFWKDVSGQGNNWTPNNLDYRDSLPDSPANNFATLNPLANVGSGSTLSEGNLQAAYGSGRGSSPATMGMPEGKWYWEATITATSAVPAYCMIGISLDSFGSDIGVYPGANSRGYGYYGLTGDKYNVSSATYGDTFTTGDIIGVAFDNDNGTLTFYKNNVSQGVAYSGLTQDVYFPVIADVNTTQTFTIVTNFGQDSSFAGNHATSNSNADGNGHGSFAYAPPSGYLALCSANLPEPTIIDGSEYFNTVLYTGNGSTQSITGVGFQPDWVWGKERPNVEANWLFDSIRGATKQISSNSTNAEGTQATMLTSFDSDGFTMGSDGAGNQLNIAYVSWNWLAGGTAVSNTDGSITSQVSANTTAKFSIVSYTGNSTAGSTVGHSLGVAPDMIIVKSRDNARDWRVYHSSLGATKALDLNTTNAAQGPNSAYWNSTDPTSSVFSIGNVTTVNGNNENYIAYCFANTDGYLKAGSYTGNGSTDGVYIHLGFSPKFWLMKSASDATHWVIYDSAREPENPVDLQLLPNESNAELASGRPVDFLSNGVKIRFSSYLNDSGQTYIFLAIGSTPQKFANAR